MTPLPGICATEPSKAIHLNPHHPNFFYNRGNARAALGDLTGAIADFTEAIRLNPSFPVAFSNRGNARRAGGDLRGARADYDAALRLNPRQAYVLADRCVLRFRQGEAAAQADCDAGIAAAAVGNGWPYVARAGIALMRNDTSAAAVDLAEALQRNPREEHMLRLRAVLRARRGDVEGAEADTAAARAIQPWIDAKIVEVFGPTILR
jgi:tetratricopeptide (TPR) repeat protein